MSENKTELLTTTNGITIDNLMLVAKAYTTLFAFNYGGTDGEYNAMISSMNAMSYDVLMRMRKMGSPPPDFNQQLRKLSCSEFYYISSDNDFTEVYTAQTGNKVTLADGVRNELHFTPVHRKYSITVGYGEFIDDFPVRINLTVEDGTVFSDLESIATNPQAMMTLERAAREFSGYDYFHSSNLATETEIHINFGKRLGNNDILIEHDARDMKAINRSTGQNV